MYLLYHTSFTLSSKEYVISEGWEGVEPSFGFAPKAGLLKPASP